MSEDPIEYTTTIQESPTNVAQVTNYDAAELLFDQWREQLPRITTALAYMEAVKLHDDLLTAIEGFEKSVAFKRITGAQ